MAVPKQRKTKSRRNQRRMHIHLDEPSFGICPKCKTPVLAHTVCKNCGYYKGKQIIDVMKKLDKKARKEKEKEIKESEKTPKKSMTMEEMSKKN